jgi:hypothetical protein
VNGYAVYLERNGLLRTYPFRKALDRLIGNHAEGTSHGQPDRASACRLWLDACVDGQSERRLTCSGDQGALDQIGDFYAPSVRK